MTINILFSGCTYVRVNGYSPASNLAHVFSTGPPSTEEEHILMEKYKELYRIALIRSAMGGAKNIHKITNDEKRN